MHQAKESVFLTGQVMSVTLKTRYQDQSASNLQLLKGRLTTYLITRLVSSRKLSCHAYHAHDTEWQLSSWFKKYTTKSSHSLSLTPLFGTTKLMPYCWCTTCITSRSFFVHAHFFLLPFAVTSLIKLLKSRVDFSLSIPKLTGQQ